MTTMIDHGKDLTIRPSSLRLAALGAVIASILALFTWAHPLRDSYTAPFLMKLLLVLMPLLTTLRDVRVGTIHVGVGIVTGPTWFGRDAIQVADIDWNRTERRTLFQRLLRTQVIYSGSGRSIRVASNWYRPEDRSSLAAVLQELKNETVQLRKKAV